MHTVKSLEITLFQPGSYGGAKIGLANAHGNRLHVAGLHKVVFFEAL